MLAIWSRQLWACDDGDTAGNLDEFLPSARAFQRSSYAIHEWLGLGWYRLSGGPAHAPTPS